MKYSFLTTTALVLFGGSSLNAHPGHLAEVAGHGHWLGAAAIGAAIALGAWAALKGKKAQQAEEDSAEEIGSDEELAEA